MVQCLILISSEYITNIIIIIIIITIIIVIIIVNSYTIHSGSCNPSPKMSPW